MQIFRMFFEDNGTCLLSFLNNRGGWKKRGGEAKIDKSLNVESGINLEVRNHL